MSRPETKKILIESACSQYEKLVQLIDSMPEEGKIAAFCFEYQGKEAHWARDKNIRDVLVHLYEWHRLLLEWVASNQRGEKKPFLPPPYSWKSYGEMNMQLWGRHQYTPYDRAREMLAGSHSSVMGMINSFSEDQLFRKGCFLWTGASSLGSYCISATSSHYNWAIKKIKRHIKTYGTE